MFLFNLVSEGHPARRCTLGVTVAAGTDAWVRAYVSCAACVCQCVRLQQGVPEVLHLLKGDPFSDAGQPPQQLRVTQFLYRCEWFSARG